MSKGNPPLIGFKEIVVFVAVIGGIYFYMHKTANLTQPKEQLIGGDYKCEYLQGSMRGARTSAFVYGAKGQAALINFLRNTSDDLRFCSTGRKTNVFNLARLKGENLFLLTPLLVHVEAFDNSVSDYPLFRVRVLNKGHKGETWYIQAEDVNPDAKVSASEVSALSQ